MNIVKFFYDSNENLLSTVYNNESETSDIPQSSDDNYVYLYTNSPYVSVDMKFKKPNGETLPVIHMTLGRDEDGNPCWQRHIPFSYTDFIIASDLQTVRLDLSFSLYYYDEYNQIRYPTTTATSIILKKTVTGNTLTDRELEWDGR